MKRLLLLVCFGLVGPNVGFADNLFKLPTGGSPEGIGVNPRTHKAYVVGEDEASGHKAIFVFDSKLRNKNIIPIANESEYVAIDASRNRIYVSTRFGTEPEDEAPEAEASQAAATAAEVPGTLTVIDGSKDTVIATYEFNPGLEPEGVVVDPERNIVYVGVKAPEPKLSQGTCSSGTLITDRDGEKDCWTGGVIAAFDAADVTKGPVKRIPAGDDPEGITFQNGLVYAANEDDGTVTIATAVVGNPSNGFSGGDY